MALFRFGSNRKLQASDESPVPAARGMAMPQESMLDAPRRPASAMGGAESPGASHPPSAPTPVNRSSDVAVSELDLGDDDFSSIFGSQPSQFSDTTAGSLRDDPWSARLRLD